MKKTAVLILVLAALLLSGCGSGAEQTMETIADEWEIPVMAAPRQTSLELPGEALACAMESDSGRMYYGDCYEVMVTTRPAGDLNATLEDITGFSREDLTVMQTQSGTPERWEFAWVSAGENGERLGRGVILDDGDYHYCLSVLQDADVQDCQVVWSEVFRSFELA